MAKSRRKRGRRRWLTILGLAGLVVVLSLVAFIIRQVAAPALTALGHRPRPSLEGLKASLEGMASDGWQTWCPSGSDSGLAQWRVSIPASRPLIAVNLAVHRMAAASGITVKSASEDRKRGMLEMVLAEGNGPGARLVVRKRTGEEADGRGQPLLALVAYEVAGEWPPQLKRISSCQQVMTVAGGERIKGAGGRQTVAYLPLEPKGYPRRDPGPNTLLVDDSPAGIRAKLSRIASLANGAVGLCVHHGSRAVEDRIVMSEVARFCASRGLVLLEPVPTARSLAASECRQSGADYLSPDLYIPRSASVSEAGASLAKAIRTADSRGSALVLLPATDNAIKAVGEAFKNGSGASCRPVPLSGLRTP